MVVDRRLVEERMILLPASVALVACPYRPVVERRTLHSAWPSLGAFVASVEAGHKTHYPSWIMVAGLVVHVEIGSEERKMHCVHA